MSTPLAEHLGKLYRIANGALKTCEIERRPEAGKSFWTGYRQALDDLKDFAGKEGLV